jgi:uncharacterized membrane protein
MKPDLSIKRPPNWLLRTRNVLIVLLVLIALVVAGRRLMSLTGMIKTYVNPKFGEFDGGFRLHPFLTFLHIIPGILFMVLTPLQFVSRIRERHIRVHRVSGWVIATAASIIGCTALVMSFTLPIGGATETAATAVFALFFLFSLYKAIYHIRKKEIRLHREWMIRMFSIGLAIATVRPIVGMFFAFSKLSPHQFFGIAFWLGFTIHLIAAECWIRCYRQDRAKNVV